MSDKWPERGSLKWEIVRGGINDMFHLDINDLPLRRVASLPPGIPTCPLCLYRNPGAQPGDTEPPGEHDCRLEDQPPVVGGTTAIRDGKYVTEERTPGPIQKCRAPLKWEEIAVCSLHGIKCDHE